MAKSGWGLKRTCQSCGVRFYDLNRSHIVCPKCAAVFDPEATLRSRRGRGGAAAKAARPAPVPVETPVDSPEVPVSDDELVPVAADDAEDEAVLEDASELGEDEDDMAEVIEKVVDEEP